MKNTFNLTIFLPESKIDPSHYRVSHNDLKSASFSRLDSEEGNPCAIYQVEMNKPYNAQDLEGEFCVTHPEYDVMGVDVFVDE
ncbi:hypothetical protein HJ167_19830 [Vibrio parahaemolyticus]|uniref:Uncharacterized protein n=1 Tax=Vibrio fluvialis PG41 TaxID=1336752 RepID=S7JC00_VIBFL|nr:hypothetical protein [Vibrio fluvialis]EPP21521.1 hypothetical protein L910_1200 [Vibrio fluvialis PG41]MBE4779846.1 hypothetical protein [Vibrio parahaemolyticus]